MIILLSYTHNARVQCIILQLQALACWISHVLYVYVKNIIITAVYIDINLNKSTCIEVQCGAPLQSAHRLSCGEKMKRPPVQRCTGLSGFRVSKRIYARKHRKTVQFSSPCTFVHLTVRENRLFHEILNTPCTAIIVHVFI